MVHLQPQVLRTFWRLRPQGAVEAGVARVILTLTFRFNIMQSVLIQASVLALK